MADKQLSKEEIEELRSLIKLLEKDIDDLEFKNLVKSGEAARTLLKSLQREAAELTSDISGIVSIFQGIVSEIKRANLGVNETTKSFRGLTSIAQKIQYHQSEISKLTEKDIRKLKEKLDQEKVNLVNADKLLKIEAQRLAQDKLASDRRIESNENERKRIEAREERLRRSGMRLSQTDKERLKELGREHGRLITQQEKINKQLQQNADSQGNIKGIIDEQDGAYNTLEATLTKINRQLKDQEKLLGLGGSIIGSLETALDKLGLGGLSKALGISDAKEEMQSLSEKIIKDKEKQLILENDIAKGIDAQTGQPYDPAMLQAKQEELAALTASNAQYDGMNGKVKILRAGISSMGKSLITNLKDPLSIAVFLTTQLFDAFKSVDAATGDLAKGFNMTYAEAAKTRSELNDIANFSMDVAVSTKGLQESMMAVGQSLGSNAKLNKEDLVTFTKLREQAGYTNDELAGIQKLSLLTNKNLDDGTKELLGSAKAHASIKGLMINEKDILREVSKASASLKLSLGGSTDALAKAAVQAKAVGLSLDQTQKIAGSLLNFEDSISAELEAELLTGKNLNLERARLAALNNDMATVAEEIANQVGSSADFTKMNVIQQEALAKSVGMTRDELAQSLIDREALAKLSGVEGETAQERFNNLVKEVGMEEAKKRLGDEQLAAQFAQQSVQERFNQTVEKLKEIFVSVASALMPVFDTLAEVFKIVGPIAGILGTIIKYTIEWGKYLLIPLGLMKGFTLAMDGIVGLQNLLNKGLTTQITKEGLLNNLKTIGNVLTLGLFSTQTKQNAAAAIELATDQGKVSFKQLAVALEGESLAVKTRAYAMALKDSVLDKGKVALAYAWNAAKAIGNGLLSIGNVLTLGMFSTQVQQNAAAATELATEQGKLSFKQLSLALEGESLAVKTRAYAMALKDYILDKGKVAFQYAWNAAKTIGNTLTLGMFSMQVQQNAASAVELATEQGKVNFKQLSLALEEESMAVKARAYALAFKDYLLDKGKLAFQYAWNAAKMIGNGLIAISNKSGLTGLVRSIGTAAMDVISSLAKIPIIGWALGLAAAGTVVALGYKFMKGNDVFSPAQGGEGYGKRTLLAPEGAIQLNNNDDVIAGTNLFGDDVLSEPNKSAQKFPKDTINIQSPENNKKEDNTSLNPKKETDMGGLSGLKEELQAIKNLLQTIASTPGTITLNGTQVGTVLTPIINQINNETVVKTP